MKTVLLAINAKFIHTNLAVRQLCAYAKAHGESAEYIEYTINNYAEEIVRGVYNAKPDLLGISCYIWNIELVEKICGTVKKILPHTKIFLGGPEVSYNPKEVLTRIKADFVISGAGEKSMLALMKAVETGDYADVSALTYHKENLIVSNAVTQMVSMSEVEFAYDNFAETQNRICYYEAQRGCPFNCKYCLSSIEKGVNFAPVDKVKKELRLFLEAKVRQVKFVDRTFNCNKKFACEIVSFLIENDNETTNFHFEVAPDLLDDEFLSLLSTARAGLFQLEIGVQSTNDHTLEAVSRHNDFEHIRYCVEKIKSAANCHVHLDLIAGLPKEDVTSFRKSFNMVHSLFPHQLQLGFLKILHGAGMEKMCEKYGIEYCDYPPYEVLSTDVLTYDDVLYLKGVEDMTEIFYNSNRFRNVLPYIAEKFDGDYFEMYARLADFRQTLPEENSLHNKNTCFEFLIAFAEKIGLDRQRAKILAKYDFILRERPRSSPLWAQDCKNGFDRNDIFDFVVTHNKAAQLLQREIEPKSFLGQCHIEQFPQPVTKDGKSCFLFDYTRRDLYGNCIAIPIF